LNRLELVGETLRHALNVLAVVAPEWLLCGWVPAEWYDRYSQRIEDYRLPPTKQTRDAYAQVGGADGATLLRQVDAAHELPWLCDLPAVQLLRTAWEPQYCHEQGAAEGSEVRWRTAIELPAPGDRLESLESPDDREARFATIRATAWRGHKVHLTETCDETGSHLITDVQTTPAPLPDVTMTQAIEQALLERDLPPAEHFVDASYTEADWIVSSQRQRGLTVVGPVRANGSWQAHEEQGYAVTQFQFAIGSASRPSARKASAAPPGGPTMTGQATR
jgi:transposase